MIAVIQRVKSARVSLSQDSAKNSSIGPGLVVLLGVGGDDSEMDVNIIATKLAKLRIFADDNQKMNLDIVTVRGELSLISQFTLLADTTGGNRPSFIKAAPPELARDLYEKLARNLSARSVPVKTGFFGEYMTIEAVLDGPVTLYLNSKEL